MTSSKVLHDASAAESAHLLQNQSFRSWNQLLNLLFLFVFVSSIGTLMVSCGFLCTSHKGTLEPSGMCRQSQESNASGFGKQKRSIKINIIVNCILCPAGIISSSHTHLGTYMGLGCLGTALATWSRRGAAQKQPLLWVVGSRKEAPFLPQRDNVYLEPEGPLLGTVNCSHWVIQLAIRLGVS